MNGAIEWNEFIGTAAAAFTVLGAMGAVIYWISLRMMVQPAIKHESDSIKAWAKEEFADCEGTALQFAAFRREIDILQNRKRGGS